MSALAIQELPLLTTLVEEAVPRPEYPQPQFQREEWVNLNGTWEFEFDDENVGLDEHWAFGAKDFSKSILVPFCFESPKSGIGDRASHAYVWYRRVFLLPDEWQGRHVLLHFGAVDYRATVWVNGKLCGEHEGGHTPFKFDITTFLTAGPNHIIVRVEDPPRDRYIPRGKQHWQDHSESIFYTRTTGIWQSVWLEPAGENYLDKVRIDTTMDGAVTFDAKIARSAPDVQLLATISYQGKVIATAMSLAEDNQVTAAAFVRDPTWWSPRNPALYDVTFELIRDDRVIDRVHSYFGFRQVSTQDGKVLLNGEPVYLKMVLDQGYWPESTLTPPSDEAIRYDLEMAKSMGFNGVRKHQKVEDPRFLYWADRMGMLVSAEMANAYMFDGESVGRLTREWIDAVSRDYNHPSIIIWVPINESWGVPNVRDARQQAHMKAMYMLTKSLDSTRLVIDNDGWEHTDCTDLFAVHDYSRNGELFYERFKTVQEGKIPVPFQGKMFLAPGYQYNGSPIFLSEFGGISYVPADTQVPENSWGYEGMEHSESATLDRVRGIYEAIAKLPRIIGICYTQLTDVEQEVNGLLTYDRRPKFDPAAIRSINGLLR